MATYVPNADDATQPTEDKFVESAALEFRTIKSRVINFSAEIVALQGYIDALEIMLEETIAAIELGGDVAALAALLIGTNGSENVGYTAPWTGAIRRLLAQRLSESMYVTDVTLYRGTLTDSSAAINSMLAQCGVLGGGVVKLGRGTYYTDDVITTDYPYVVLEGESHNGYHLAFEGATQIIARHTAGPVIRIKQHSCGAIQLNIGASGARLAAAFTSSNHGILVEGDDGANVVMQRQLLAKLRIGYQPAAGLILVGAVQNSEISNVDVDHCGSHGYLIDGGEFTGRTPAYRDRPGQVKVQNCRSSRNGGHAIVVGGPSTQAIDRPYRIHIENFEPFYNCYNPSVLYFNSEGYFWGENITVTQSAFGSSITTAPYNHLHKGVYVAGKSILFTNNRFVDAETFIAQVIDRGSAGESIMTANVKFEFMWINHRTYGSGYYNPAIEVDPTCLNVKAFYDEGSLDVTSIMRTDSINYEIQQNNFQRFAGYYIAGHFGSRAAIATLDDDKAGYWTFSELAYGVITIVSSTQGGGSVEVQFRTGDGGAFLEIMSDGAVTVGTSVGVLANGGGPDGQISLSVTTTNNRLYISNRTAATRGYGIQVRGGRGLCTGFVNL